MARLALRALPLRAILTQVAGARVAAPPCDAPQPARVAWAIGAAGRRLPGGQNCLVQAVAGRLLLAQYGYTAELRIGVARGAEGKFQAHAWVECGGRAVIGGAGVTHFNALPMLARDPYAE